MVALGFRLSQNPWLSRVLGGLGVISLGAKLIAVPLMLPIRVPGDVSFMPAPWTNLGMLIPVLGALVVLAIIARPMRRDEVGPKSTEAV